MIKLCAFADESSASLEGQIEALKKVKGKTPLEYRKIKI